jgi:hypothetical protein
MTNAIRAASRTLADFLQAAFEGDPDLGTLFADPGIMRVYLNTPAEMSDTRRGLSVWLYRVTSDEPILNRPPERISPTGTQPTPLPVRLHYLVTPVTNTNLDDAPETEQVILGRTLQVLHDHPTLSGVDLKDDFEGTRAVVTARLETLTIDELAQIWDALATSYRTSVSYEVTVVDIEAPTRHGPGSPVRVR